MLGYIRFHNTYQLMNEIFRVLAPKQWEQIARRLVALSIGWLGELGQADVIKGSGRSSC
jgi:hypothetical protein